jgi:(p)ppGpp synthase/HD superfamily hydrolase
LPGDPIIGRLSTGRGIVIHRDTCKNVADYQKAPDKWLEVEWESDSNAEFSAELRLAVNNKRGVLANIAVAIAEAEANIENINTSERDGVTTTMDLLLNVHSRTHLATIMRRLRTVPGVLRIARRT